MEKQLEKLLKDLDNVEREKGAKDATYQKVLIRLRNQERKQKFQYRIVLVVATMLVIFLISILWTNGKIISNQETIALPNEKSHIERIYVHNNFKVESFLARPSIFYLGVHKVPTSNTEFYDLMTYIIQQMEPIDDSENPEFDYSDADFVIVLDNGERLKLKWGTYEESSENILLNWETNTYYKVPELNEEQQGIWNGEYHHYSPIFSMWILLLILLNIIVEKIIRKKYHLQQRIKLYETVMGNTIFALSLVLLISPILLSIFNIQIHMVVSLILILVFSFIDWLWYQKQEKSRPRELFKMWSVVYFFSFICMAYLFM